MLVMSMKWAFLNLGHLSCTPERKALEAAQQGRSPADRGKLRQAAGAGAETLKAKAVADKVNHLARQPWPYRRTPG
jgi:hypothetical protein